MRNYFKALWSICIIIIIIQSCSIWPKKQFSNKELELKQSIHLRHSGKYKYCSYCNPSLKETKDLGNLVSRNIQYEAILNKKPAINPARIWTNRANRRDVALFPVINPHNRVDNFVAHSTNANDSLCDVILLKTGEEIKAKVLEVGTTEIKYKLCDNLDGPIFSKYKSEVFLIKYPNGTSTVISSLDTPKDIKIGQVKDSNNKTIHPLSIVAFITSIIGLFIFGILFGLASIITGAISISKIKKNPEQLSGKGLATVAIIIGIIDVVVVLILIALLI